MQSEWAAMTGEAGRYSPRLDVAVGPFATQDLMCGGAFNQLVGAHQAFLIHLIACSVENFQEYGGEGIGEISRLFHGNDNARCFLAIEIENQSSRKHLMGGAINAAALGRIGIAVGWTPDKVKAFVKLRNYLLFLTRVGKNSFDPYNLLILSAEQFSAALTRQTSA